MTNTSGSCTQHSHIVLVGWEQAFYDYNWTFIICISCTAYVGHCYQWTVVSIKRHMDSFCETSCHAKFVSDLHGDVEHMFLLLLW